MGQKSDTRAAKEGREKAGEYIKRLRTDIGLSQLDLARRLGYSYYSFISQIESGATRLPPHSLKKWAFALNVDVKNFATTLLRYYEPFYFDAIFSAAPAKSSKDSAEIESGIAATRPNDQDRRDA